MTEGIRVRRTNSVLVAFAIASIVSCSDSPSSPDPIRVLELVTPQSIEARAGSIVNPPPAIRVVDQRTGHPVPAVKVEFVPAIGAGYVDNPVTSTDEAGVATAGMWRVGNRTGVFSMSIKVGGQQALLTVKIVPDVPAGFFASPFTPIGGTDELLAGPAVQVVDRFRNPTPRIPVVFTVVSGNGALEKSTQVTNDDGVARAGVWHLGSKPGENAVVAAADGIEPVRFSVLAIDAELISQSVLHSVRQWDRLRTPSEVGIAEAKLRTTVFDRCLCRNESGYYILEARFTIPTPEPPRIAGRFTLVPPQIQLLAPQIKSVKVRGGQIEIEIERNDYDWIWTEIWIFE
jgi:hypothetical protein